MPSGSRLVASRCTLGHLATMASAILAQAPIRCSQLSSTIRMSCGARASSRASRTGRPGGPAIPSAREMAGATAFSSATAASSTSQTPSPDPSSNSAATWRPSLVLPAPPAPVTVTRREDSTRARTSRQLPVTADEGGQLGREIVRQRRVVQRAQRRELSWQARRLQLEDLLRAAQVLQPVHTEIPQRRAGRKRVAHQRRRRLREQDLTAVRDGRHPGGPVDIQAHQAGGRLGRLTGMDPHPHPDAAPRQAMHAPRWPAASAITAATHAVGEREHGEERVSLGIHLPAAVSGQGGPDKRVVAGKHLRIGTFPQAPEQCRRALDVGKQKRESLHGKTVEGTSRAAAADARAHPERAHHIVPKWPKPADRPDSAGRLDRALATSRNQPCLSAHNQ